MSEQTAAQRRDVLGPTADPTAVRLTVGDLHSYPGDTDPLDRFEVPVSASDVPEDVLALAETHVGDPREGFFEPGSVVREVLRGKLLYMGVATGILLQIAHPKVGQGVTDHGTLEHTPLERLKRTFDAFDAVIFGDAGTAVRAAVTVRTLHERVRGTVEADAAHFEEGEAYHANDPDLLAWVAATLVEMPMRNYETYVRGLSAAERERFTEQMSVCNRLLGVPESHVPDSYADLRSYFDRVLETEITDNAASDRIVEGFLSNAPATPVVRFLASSQLPSQAREALGLSWDGRRQRAFDGLAGVIRGLPIQRLPDRVHVRANPRLYDRG